LFDLSRVASNCSYDASADLAVGLYRAEFFAFKPKIDFTGLSLRGHLRKLRRKLLAPIFLYPNTYANKRIVYSSEELVRSGDIHNNPGPVREHDINLSQCVDSPCLRQRLLLDTGYACSWDFPKVRSPLLVDDRDFLLTLYHRRQPARDVRTILYAAGLLVRRRRGTKAGSRQLTVLP
jgi:hypothetical protein